MIKLAFFDVDGTLSSPRYYMNGKFQIGQHVEGWIQYCEEHKENSYEFCYGIKPVRKHAEALKESGAKLYVLSSVASEWEKVAKTKFIRETYPGLFDDFFYVYHDPEKISVIKEIAAREGAALSECEFVEDTLQNLFEANIEGIVPMHVSMLIDERPEA